MVGVFISLFVIVGVFIALVAKVIDTKENNKYKD